MNIRIKDPKKYSKKRIQVAFDFWSEGSQWPFGHFIKVIGDEGDARTEGDVILLENDIKFEKFSTAVMNCLPPDAKNWSIPEEELLKRKDLRHLNIVSVDPPGCRDIDDALHCIKLPNGNF